MYKKDLIETEIQRLTDVLARIIGLKKEGNTDEAHSLSLQTLLSEFGLEPNVLDTATPSDFAATLAEKTLSEKKLNLLAQLLFESAHPFEDTPEIHNRLHLVNVIFNQLETVFHTQSLDNLAIRRMIDNFLNNDQYE